MNKYTTVKQPAMDEFIIKKSRFIGQIYPVSNEEQATALISHVKTVHKGANHNVYGYIVRQAGSSTNIKRFSDDGEPQGTGGMPILEVIEREGIVDVIVVVTRYFGGTLLGAGGLTRAYANGAKIAIDKAEKMLMVSSTLFHITFDYTFYGSINHILPEFKLLVKDTYFGSEIKMTILIVIEQYELFKNQILEMTSGTVSPVDVGEEYAEL